MNNTTLDEIRKQQIAAMTRKELNAHAYLCEKEQEQYAAELQQLREELEQVKKERDGFERSLDTLAAHFNNTTEELEKAYEDDESLRSELAAKGKVMEQIANTLKEVRPYIPENLSAFEVEETWYVIDEALKQYARSAIVPNE